MGEGVKILNLYAGLGGNRKLWDELDVTSVEMESNIAEVYQSLYKNDKLIIGDAHKYLLSNFEKFDFIWSSPPCQSHSRMAVSGRNRTPRYPDMKLYEEIIFLQQNFKGLWVVENVKPYYEPLIKPTQVVGRHLFWSNFYITCNDVPSPGNFINQSSKEGARLLKEWLGIDYGKDIYYKGNHCPAQVLRNCVHPFIGRQVLNSAIGKKENIKGLAFDQASLLRKPDYK